MAETQPTKYELHLYPTHHLAMNALQAKGRSTPTGRIKLSRMTYDDANGNVAFFRSIGKLDDIHSLLGLEVDECRVHGPIEAWAAEALNAVKHPEFRFRVRAKVFESEV